MRNDVAMLPIDKLNDFEAQPYKVVDDDAMYELAESIKNVGVLVPIIVRKAPYDRYEIISGHRRKRACEIAGITTIPSTIMQLNDDEAAIMLVDSNLQRENLLPSEKAYAYKLKLDAIKHQGSKNEYKEDILTESADNVGLNTKKSGRQIRRYIRLTELIFPLLDKVDVKIIPVMAGAEISYLNVKFQVILNDQIEYFDCKVNINQAEKLKRLYLDGHLDERTIKAVLTTQDENTTLSIDCTKLRKYFPKHYTAKQCETAMWKILDDWFAKHSA